MQHVARMANAGWMACMASQDKMAVHQENLVVQEVVALALLNLALQGTREMMQTAPATLC